MSRSLPLRLLIFIDDRSSSREICRQVQTFIESETDGNFEMQVYQIANQPHLVEHYRLVATPALVKVFPEPQQTLAGSDLLEQLKKLWPQWWSFSREPKEAELVPSVTEVQDDSFTASSERMRLSDEIFKLKREKQELKEQLQFKDQILEMLAHDLRSPLTAASIAMETLKITEKQKFEQLVLREQLFSQAHKQFRSMNWMIETLLEASKNVGKELFIEPRKIDLQQLCEDIFPQFEKRFQDKEQRFIQDIPKDLPPVFGDYELIRQVLINLLDNACKYTQVGGEITISMLHRTSQKIETSICDNGPGIPLAKQERIFEGRFRLERDKAEDGYGLGLALCRKIIRAHYGQISVDSTLGKGCCFNFFLPVYR
ncbi:MAG: histidine kinase [Cyanobacteria bacterium P01_H01_bin.15]